MGRRTRKIEVPICEKITITLEEAAAYTGIGREALRELTLDPNCPFVLWIGRRRVLKRKAFEKYIGETYSI